MALKRVRVGVVVGLLIGLASAGAMVPAHAVEAGSGKPALTSTVKSVEEGDRLTLTAVIASPARAARATLQKEQFDIWGAPSWVSVKTEAVRGRKKVPFKTVATDENNERYRVAVSYAGARSTVSNPLTVVVWRWIPLSEYAPYYESESLATRFGTVTIDGRAYAGWGLYSFTHTGTWESRFTPGRHCRSFRAVLGLSDSSADGSSGSISLSADDEPIYTSPALTPGMSVPVRVDLAEPYRFGIQLLDTTPSGSTGDDAIEARPALGDPAFLCTGV